MEFDLRYKDYTFKHSFSQKPDMNAARFREHYHTSYELLFFISGNAQFMVQHTLYSIKPGSLLIAKPGEYHNIIFLSDDPYERYVIRFSPNVVYPHINKQLEMTKSVYYIEDTPIADEFRRMDQHFVSVHPDVRLEACIGSNIILLSYLISSDKLAQSADYVNSSSKRIFEYIDAHLAEIQSVSDLSSALHMSKSSIYAIFSEQLSTSVMSYVRTQKCMVARSLLREGASATDVAARLGFNHYSSFYRDYQRVFHEPPSGKPREL